MEFLSYSKMYMILSSVYIFLLYVNLASRLPFYGYIKMENSYFQVYLIMPNSSDFKEVKC